MITQNFSTLKWLVNDIIGKVYNMIWENRVEDSFAIILAVILVAVDNYAGSVNMVVNRVYVVPVVLVEAQ